MSLNWSVSSVEGYKDLCYRVAEEDMPGRDIMKGDTYLNPITEALIFATMAIDLGAITKKNWEEFYARLRLVELVNGPFLHGVQGPIYIKPEQVKAHIGLRCNVIAKPVSRWLKKVYNEHLLRCGAACREI